MVRTSLRPADLLDLTVWPDGMRVNRAPRAAPSGRLAALRGRGRLPTPPSPPARGWVSSPISRCATGYEPAARGPHPLSKRHRARPLPLAGFHAEPRPVPSHGPGPQATTTTKDPWPVERPDHCGPTRGRPSHPHATINSTTPATTPQTSTQPADEKSRPDTIRAARVPRTAARTICSTGASEVKGSHLNAESASTE